MSRKRMTFSEGGQPVYLDDLETMQGNAAADLAGLAAALAGGEKAFLLRELTQGDAEIGEDGKTVTLDIHAGSAMIDGEIAEWERTSVTVDTGAEDINTLYLCVSREETDRRAFEDGQTRPCGAVARAYLSKTADGADWNCNIYEMPTLAELMHKSLTTPEPSYRDMAVSFMNGYKGEVKVKAMTDAYRVSVDIKSDSAAALTGRPELFRITEDNPSLTSGTFASPATACVLGASGLRSFGLLASNGTVFADFTFPTDGLTYPAQLPVKITFDIPK